MVFVGYLGEMLKRRILAILLPDSRKYALYYDMTSFS
jgi:hypothetical protein